MRIVITADLHYGMRPDGDESTRALALKICKDGGDVLALCGDNAAALGRSFTVAPLPQRRPPIHHGQSDKSRRSLPAALGRSFALRHDLCKTRQLHHGQSNRSRRSLPAERFIECLTLFNAFPGRKLIVSGNHDIWVNDGAPFDSYELYSGILPRIYRQCGFHCLDEEPLVIDGVGFVGGIGWYDYTFREPSLDVPMETYRKKVLDDGTIWMDARYVRWKFSDPEFTELTLAKLREHLAMIEPRCKTIVGIFHHLPFANMVTRKADRSWTFANAFMGSGKFGEELLRHPKVRHIYCGHTHSQGEFQNGHIRCVNVGSTYRQKRHETLEL